VTGGTELRERATALADGLEGVSVDRSDGNEVWTVASQPFAVLTDEAIELRMDPAVAHAATRTPDTTVSERGPEWIRFEPAELDEHATDRLEAWFAHAYRRARD
jgi:hypothetical protein